VWMLALLLRQALAAIEIGLENPGAGQALSGIALISGFAFSSRGVPVSVRLRVDGATQNIVIPCCGPRQDVVAAFGGTTPLNTSFGLLLNYGLLEAGPHTIGVEASAPQEAPVIRDHTVTIARPGEVEFLTAFDLAGAPPPS
jgi:hypothetical protein